MSELVSRVLDSFSMSTVACFTWQDSKKMKSASLIFTFMIKNNSSSSLLRTSSGTFTVRVCPSVLSRLTVVFLPCADLIKAQYGTTTFTSLKE